MTTQTRSLSEARSRRWAILANIEGEFEHARKAPGSADWIKSVARGMIAEDRHSGVVDDIGVDWLIRELVRIRGYRLDDHEHPIIPDANVAEALTSAADLLAHPDDLRLAEVIKVYLDEKDGSIRASTLSMKKRILEEFSEWLGDKRTSQITRAALARTPSDGNETLTDTPT